MAKKLLINKSDTVEHIIELLETTHDNDLILVVPRAARLRESRDQLHTLRSAVEEMGKTITIESIDEELLALAHAAHLPAAHPFFHSDRRSFGMSDIVRPDEAAVPPPTRKVPVKKSAAVPAPKKQREEEVTDEDDAESNGQASLGASRSISIPVVVEPALESPDDTARAYDRREGSRERRRSRRVITVGVIILVLALAGVALASGFTKANVDVTLKEVPWSYDGTVTVSTGVASTTGNNSSIPGQLFVSRKNVTQSFPATGAAPGTGSFAKGTIKVFNAYDTNPQELVVKTRFLAPDGKLFRLTKTITVPAATKDAGGKIVPTSIDADVIADQAGDAYNSSDATLKLSIPGFKGTPQETGFYGMMVSTSGGGSTGTKVTSGDDVAKAQQQIETLLSQSFRAALAASQPKDLTVIDGATTVDVSHISVDRATDAAGNFNVFIDANLNALAFREADLKTVLLSVAADQQAANGSPATAWNFRTVKFVYSNVQPVVSSGSMTLNVHVEGTLVAALSSDEVATLAAGKSTREAEAAVKATPNVTAVNASAGPFWRRSMPADARGITVTIN